MMFPAITMKPGSSRANETENSGRFDESRREETNTSEGITFLSVRERVQNRSERNGAPDKRNLTVP